MDHVNDLRERAVDIEDGWLTLARVENGSSLIRGLIRLGTSDIELLSASWRV